MAHGFLNGARYDEEIADLAALIERTAIEFKIPYGVKMIGRDAFSYTTTLKKVELCEGLEYIDTYGFRMSGIVEMEIPQTVRELRYGAVYGCPYLKTFKSGAALDKIETLAFYNCRKCLLYDFSQCKQIPSLVAVDAFELINAEAKILVPAALYHEWIKATNWSAYADYILVKAPEFPDPGYVSQGLEINNGIVEGLGSCTDSTVVIPSEYNGEPVTDIDISGMDEETIEHLVFNDLICYVSWTLGYLPELKRVTFGAGLKGVGPGVFNENAKCTVYDFTRCLAVPELQLWFGDKVFSFTGMPDDCRIYVPHSLYDEWINDTNWSYYADRIVPAI